MIKLCTIRHGVRAKLLRLLLPVVVGIAFVGSATLPMAAQSCPSDTTSASALRDAMHQALLTPGGSYSILATTNSVRFQSAVFQSLIEHALKERPGGGMLFIPYDALWLEYLYAAGLGEGEGDKAPIGRRLAYEYHQDIEVFYGPPDSVIKPVKAVLELLDSGHEQLPLGGGLRRPQVGRAIREIDVIVAGNEPVQHGRALLRLEGHGTGS